MSAHISWYVPRKISYIELSGIVTMDDIEGVVTQLHNEEADVKAHHPPETDFATHILITKHLVEKFDFNPLELMGFLRTLAHDPFQHGCIAIINGQSMTASFTNTLISMMSFAVKRRVQGFFTLEEALTYFEELDEKLFLTSSDGHSRFIIG